LYKGKRILGLIPARAGSKGVPGKNTKIFCGKPLYHWTVEAALESNHLTDIAITTDDPNILEDGSFSKEGLKLIRRPERLSNDSSPSYEYVEHAINFLPTEYDYICILQPTSPLREAIDIDSLIIKVVDASEDYGVTVTDVPHQYTPESLMLEEGPIFCTPLIVTVDRKLQRQNKRPYIARNGAAVYLLSCEQFLKTKNVVGDRAVFHKMSPLSSIDIDDSQDFYLAELVMKDRKCYE
jgi:CMP-N-acetylneuraminic acid synthetase